MQLVELANAYSSKIEVSNRTLTVDAKSIMSVMRLGAAQGTALRIVADGSDCSEAVEALCKLIEGGFGEMEGPVEDAGVGDVPPQADAAQ